MKPVEIEFIMRDKLSGGIENAGKATTSLGDRVEQVSKNIKERLSEQQAAVKRVEKDLQSLEAQYAKLAPGKAQLEMKAEINACRQALDEEKASLTAVQGEHEKTAGSAKRLAMQLREMQDAMARLRIAGKETTPEYQKMAAQAAILSDTIGDLRAQTTILAHDNSGLQGVISGVNALSGGFTVATGLMGAFARENEDLVKIQTRVQSVMAVTMGLQQVMNTLNRDSAFRLVTLVKAKALLAAANTRLAVSLGISTAAAQALMATLTLGLSVVITALVIAWNRFNTATEKSKKALSEFAAKVSEMAAAMAVDFQRMVTQWAALGDSLEAKKTFVDQNADAFKKLGVSVTDVAAAENLLVKNKDVFIESIQAKAKAAAAMDLAAEKYKAAIQKALEAEAMPDKVTRYRVTGNNLGGWVPVENPKKTKAAADAQALEAEASALIGKSVAYSAEQNKLLQDAGIDTVETLVEGSVAAIEKIIEQKKAALRKITSPTEYQAALKEIKTQERLLEKITGGQDKPAPTNNMAELELRARQKIEDQSILLTKEGYERERAEAKLNFDREKQRIEEEEKQRNELYKKLRAAGVSVTPEQKANIPIQAAAQKLQAAQLYDAQMAEINKKEQKETKEKLDSLLAPYMDYTARRLEIERKYLKDVEAIQNSTADADTKARSATVAGTKRQKDLDALDKEIVETAKGSSVLLQRLFANATQQSRREIENAIADAEKLIKLLAGDMGSGMLGFTPEEVAAMQKDSTLIQSLIQGIIERKDELYGRKGYAARFAGSFKEIKEALQMEDAEKRTSALNKGIGGMIESGQALAGAFGNVSDRLARIAELSGDSSLAEFAGNLKLISDTVSSSFEMASAGLAIGGPAGAAVGAAVGGITSLLTASAEAQARHHAALKEIEAARLSFQHQYNLLLLEQNMLLEDAENIFGEQKILRAAAAMKSYSDALQQFQTLLEGSAPRKIDYFNPFAPRWGMADYEVAQKNYESGYGALNQAQIVTGHQKTGLFGWGKGKDVYSNILEVYPDLIDTNGELDTAMLQVILDTQKMDEETRTLLQSLLDLQDVMDSAEASLESYLQETFGDLGSSLLDSITSAVRKGGDIMEGFAKDIALTFEKLGEQIAYSLFLADNFDNLQKALKELYSSGKSEQDIANEAASLISDFFSGIVPDATAAQAFIEAWKANAKEMGFDLYAPDKAGQSARAGAFTTMTQDQGTKLEGLFTASQMHEANIDDNVENILTALAGALEKLQTIANNTNYCKLLETITVMLSEMKRDGIKMK